MQLKLHMVTIEDLVPVDHFLRKLAAALELSFVYEETAHMYCRRYGRPPIDPVVLVKYLLVGYKHNPEGIKASIALRQEQGNAVIRIADSGKPLPADMDIFEPFVTENTACTAGQGTGLGLAITKRIIQRHGGEIHTEALDGAYTKAFVVRLKSL